MMTKKDLQYNAEGLWEKFMHLRLTSYHYIPSNSFKESLKKVPYLEIVFLRIVKSPYTYKDFLL